MKYSPEPEENQFLTLANFLQPYFSVWLFAFNAGIDLLVQEGRNAELHKLNLWQTLQILFNFHSFHCVSRNFWRHCHEEVPVWIPTLLRNGSRRYIWKDSAHRSISVCGKTIFVIEISLSEWPVRGQYGTRSIAGRTAPQGNLRQWHYIQHYHPTCSLYPPLTATTHQLIHLMGTWSDSKGLKCSIFLPILNIYWIYI